MPWVSDPNSGLDVWVSEQEQPERTTLGKAIDWTNEPVSTMVAHAAGLPSISEAISEPMAAAPVGPGARGTPGKAILGLAEGLTTLQNLALTASGLGGGALIARANAALKLGKVAEAASLFKAAKAAHAAEAGLSLPYAAEGAIGVVKEDTLKGKALSALEAGLGTLGLAAGAAGAGKAALGADFAREFEVGARIAPTDVGRPVTRRRYQQYLLEQGVTGEELTGKSAKDLREMVRARGIDPRTLEPALEELGPEGESLVPPSPGGGGGPAKGPGNMTRAKLGLIPEDVSLPEQVRAIEAPEELAPEMPRPLQAPNLIPEKTIYHGTPQAGFEAFEQSKQNASALYGPGVYFTDSSEVAGSYTRTKTGSAPAVIPARLRVQKVLDMDSATVPADLLEAFPDQWDAPVGATGSNQFSSVDDFYGWLVENVGNKAEANDWLNANGYDALTYTGGRRTGGAQHQVWVVLDPSKIRSSITGVPLGRSLNPELEPEARLAREEATSVEGAPSTSRPAQYTKEDLSQRAWHPDMGVVKIEIAKGEDVLVLPERGKPRLVKRWDLKMIPDESIEPGLMETPESIEAEIAGLTPEERLKYGLDDTVEPYQDEAVPPTPSSRELRSGIPGGEIPTKENLLKREGLHAGPVVAGKQYEVRAMQISDPQQRAVWRQIGSGEVGQRTIRLVEGILGKMASEVGSIMRRLPGLSAEEASFLAVPQFRGFARIGSNSIGRNFTTWLDVTKEGLQGVPGGGGFVLDPWRMATHVAEYYNGAWREPLAFRQLPEDLKIRAASAAKEGKQLALLPRDLQLEIASSLWAAQLRYTVLHEPLHSIRGAVHAGPAAPRFGALWKQITQMPELWNADHYRALQEPRLRKQLVEMYETFLHTADGTPPQGPPPPPPPPGEPPRPLPPPPPPSPEATLQERLKEMMVKQRVGTYLQKQRVAILHAKQAEILNKWDAAVAKGEVAAETARAEQMKELAGLEAETFKVDVPSFSPSEIEQVQKTLRNPPWGPSLFEKMRAAKAFEKSRQGMQLQKAEVELLARFFPKTIAGYDPSVFTQILNEVLKLHGSSRAVITSYDLSAAMRQGLLLTVSHPGLASKAFYLQMKALRSEASFEAIEKSIFNNPMRDLQEAAGLHLSTPNYRLGMKEAYGMGGAEEFFQHATYAEKIPGVRPSERAYITYLNKLRVEVFNKWAYEMLRDGMSLKTHPQEFIDLAKAINTMSGRGTMEAFYISPTSIMGKAMGIQEPVSALSKYGEPAVPLMNVALFAPRFMASRLAILRDLPLLYTNYSGPARQLLLRDVGLTVGAGLSALAFAKIMGTDVEMSLLSSDFAKIRVGDTRYDPWGGFQPYVRFWAQMAYGQRKPTMAGWGGLEPVNRLDLLYRFGEQKLSPSAGLAADILRGKDFVGRPNEFLQDEFPWIGRGVWSRITPMVAQDIAAVSEQGDLEQLLLTVPASLLGVSVQTYESRRRGY